MKKAVVLILAVSLSIAVKAQTSIYMAKSSEITFFSEATLENIDAKNNTGKPVLNTKTGDLQVQVTMKGFKFKSPLMEEHFNETYVESDKYPQAKFLGKIKDNDKIDYTKDGSYDVIVEGPMTMHGETKNVTATGKLTVSGNKILIDSKFKLKLADYKVDVPKNKLSNIAEVVDVTVKAILEPFEKK
ncbi:MAG: YceI family protein [Bacteroidetes bacterium]|nr:YceI family protein [Bacteroidota bacterium]